MVFKAQACIVKVKEGMLNEINSESVIWNWPIYS